MQLATQNKTRCSSECNGNKTRRARTFCFDALLGRNSIGRSHCSRKASSEIASLTCVYGIPGRTTGARASPSGPAPHRLSCSANLNRATCPLDQPDVIGPPIQPKIDIRVVVSERASGAGSLGASRDLNSGLLRLRTVTTDCERDVLLQSRIRDESPAHGQAGNSTLPSPSSALPGHVQGTYKWLTVTPAMGKAARKVECSPRLESERHRGGLDHTATAESEGGDVERPRGSCTEPADHGHALCSQARGPAAARSRGGKRRPAPGPIPEPGSKRVTPCIGDRKSFASNSDVAALHTVLQSVLAHSLHTPYPSPVLTVLLHAVCDAGMPTAFSALSPTAAGATDMAGS
jgi:hypothetical protein